MSGEIWVQVLQHKAGWKLAKLCAVIYTDLNTMMGFLSLLSSTVPSMVTLQFPSQSVQWPGAGGGPAEPVHRAAGEPEKRSGSALDKSGCRCLCSAWPWWSWRQQLKHGPLTQPKSCPILPGNGSSYYSVLNSKSTPKLYPTLRPLCNTESIGGNKCLLLSHANFFVKYHYFICIGHSRV